MGEPNDEAACRAELRLTFDSPEQARAVREALAPEDAGWVTSRVEGATLRATVEAARLGAFVRTVDDYLGGVTAAVRAAAAVSPRRPGKKPS